MDKNQSEMIKKIRKKSGLNTKDFGETLGVSGRTVEGWEYGKTVPEPILRLIKNIYGHDFSLDNDTQFEYIVIKIERNG